MSTPTRNRETNGTQSLVRTLLGDYTWADAGGPIPAGVFTRVLAEFGISDMAARLALERVAGHGFLMRDMLGRAVLYRLSDWALAHHQERFARLLGTDTQPAPWDGQWTLVLASVPEAQRELRAQLRTRLLAARFARFYDAAWLRPGAAGVQTAREVLDSLGAPEPLQVTVLCARHEAGFGGRNPLEAYDLDTVASHYTAFIEQYAPLVKRAREGRVPTSDALVRRTQLMDAWRSAVRNDPLLPTELLPANFPREQARALFIEAYDHLGPPAAEQLRRLVASVRPEIAPHLRHRQSSYAEPRPPSPPCPPKHR
ncbi:PaaX family transcriptional regulator [Roseateles paludis]|uniref:PaaX family transcriptional regulator C-terminal domain-containing protein n=1 Tax=Roseateles paludis TaxID=3145238 RepID=A0ABV0FX45_9BURK